MIRVMKSKRMMAVVMVDDIGGVVVVVVIGRVKRLLKSGENGSQQ